MIQTLIINDICGYLAHYLAHAHGDNSHINTHHDFSDGKKEFDIPFMTYLPSFLTDAAVMLGFTMSLIIAVLLKQPIIYNFIWLLTLSVFHYCWHLDVDKPYIRYLKVYHIAHHHQPQSNYSFGLFPPILDYLFGTL